MNIQEPENHFGRQKYFDKYYEEKKKDGCCVKCLKSCTKKICHQILKLVIFFGLLGGLGYGVYWGGKEIHELNDFDEVTDGCTIVSVGEGVACDECHCSYYYNAWKLEREKVCSSCESIKYNYIVTSAKCGEEQLVLDGDYYNDLSCGVPLKNVNQSYTCYLYGNDCRGKYSFDTMYADKNQLTIPLIVMITCCILIIIVLLIRCLCC
jgi:hypothetical protein